MTRLNLGCGGQIVDGWVNVDRAFDASQRARAQALKHTAQSQPIVQYDLADTPWPWDDNSIDMVAFHHVLDLLTTAQLLAACRETHRVLRGGGMVRCSSAHFGKAIEAAYADDLDWFRERLVPEQMLVDVHSAFGWWWDCGGARKTVLATPQILAGAFGLAGFRDVEEVDYCETTGLASITELDSREGESWFIEARKS